MDDTSGVETSARQRMLAGLPVHERRLRLAGVPTAVLEGGEGPSMVLLHGPGEFAGGWLPVLPDLVRSHHVVAPDLPGHGASRPVGAELDVDGVLRWLGELVAHTCPAPPVLVGRVVGGAIGARFAAAHPGALAHLVLVDTLGLAAFEPAPRFGLALHRFIAAPTAHSYSRFMEFCTFDLDEVRERLAERWEPFATYAVELARTPEVQAALGSLIEQFAATPLPSAELAAIRTPTTLIWGRHDLATPLGVAEQAAERYGWPLHVIEDAGDDPALERPGAFLDALRSATGHTTALSTATEAAAPDRL